MAYEKTQWVNNQTKLNVTNMNKIENGIETNSNNMPNGINVDSDKYLILEHDGVEITGQKKLIKYPFTYNSSTNTFGIDTNLYVDGIIKSNEVMISKSIFDIYNNSQITFYENNIGSKYISILPNFDIGEIQFVYESIEDHTIVKLGTNESANILTSANTKTVFGNQSIYGSGNIDLYRHQLKVRNSSGSVIYFVIISSSNLKVDSLQDLTSVTKATTGYFTLAIHPSETDTPVLVTYNNNVWGSSIGAITEILEDKITTI